MLFVINNSGFDGKLDGKYEIRLKGPRAELVGPYRVIGRILILPIQGDGISNITVCKLIISIFFM